MADLEPGRGDNLQGPLNSHPPDMTTGDVFAPSTPHRNASTTTDSSDRTADTCRICRSEGTVEEPLFYPCKCSGSIKFVHQECLMEWLSHSHKKYCELCQTPFRFTKLYDANMPQELPWPVFVRRACGHVVLMLARGVRGLVVSAVWLVALPYLIRWAWRWMFWLADAGWAREAFMHKLRQASLVSATGTNGSDLAAPAAILESTNGTTPAGPAVYQLAKEALAYGLNMYLGNATFGADASPFLQESWPQADVSIFSSWTYLAQLTSNPRWNREMLDVMEGQIITCVVIVGFILIFLIREWVVQQQPQAHHLANLEHLPNVQAELQDAIERGQANNDRLRHQQELLEQAQQRLLELQNETHGTHDFAEMANGQDHGRHDAGRESSSWSEVEVLVDQATKYLREDGGEVRQRFLDGAQSVTQHVRYAGRSGGNFDALTQRLSEKLNTYSDTERRAWEDAFKAELERLGGLQRGRRPSQPLQSSPTLQPSGRQSTDEPYDTDETRAAQPPLPDGDFTLRSTQIQRLLEEAEGVFGPHMDVSTVPALRGSANIDASTSTSDLAGGPHHPGSWREAGLPVVGPKSERDQRHDHQHDSLILDEMPITNAGPDVKSNIQRRGKGKVRPVPEPATNMDAHTKSRKQVDEAIDKLEEEIRAEDASDARGSQVPQADAQLPTTNPADNPSHQGHAPNPERRQSDTFGHRVASVFREEFGLDETEELGNRHQAGLGFDDQTAPNGSQPEVPPPARPGIGTPTHRERIVDWFWGDIFPEQVAEPVPTAPEERVEPASDGDEQDPPFIPISDGQLALPAPDDEPEPHHVQDPAEPEHPDAEVLAAAEEAGLDAEAIEDAEDLEGIFELIGLHGPIIGLFQTATFCTVLVAGTVIGTVGLPYAWGKLVLCFVANPVSFLITMPLQVASGLANFVVDVTLLFSGWTVLFAALAVDSLSTALQACAPKIGSLGKVPGWVSTIATATAHASAGRLRDLFITTHETIDGVSLDSSWALISANVHAHASLKYVEGELVAILDWIGKAAAWIVNNASASSIRMAWPKTINILASLPSVPTRSHAWLQVLQRYAPPLLKSLGLDPGFSTFESVPHTPLDPSLVYWSSTDRTLAVVAGYLSLALLATFYVAIDLSITRSESGRRTEKAVRDTLRQAGGVLKVILIISIEMLVFPLYCGLLLDIAFLPLFQGASVSSRWAFAMGMPYTFCFVHWFLGTCYMFHFALFVGMCRKVLRKGVLWFIRDPDDPTFHPVRDVLERNVTTQLHKLAFSALVYGALVILCLGGVIWGIGQVFEGIFPIHWASPEPVVEFPMDLMLYNAVTPLVIRLFKPSDAVNAMYAWWLRRCARVLRLSHFLFDDRRKDEEGREVRKGWPVSSALRVGTDTKNNAPAAPEDRQPFEEPTTSASFHRDGKYVLTPCNDQYRPPKPGEAFLHYADDSDDVYITDKDGKRNDHFSKVYVPPHFKLRMTMFMVCLWVFSAFTGLCATLVPLCFGRQLFAAAFGGDGGARVNDIYAYTVGAYVLGGVAFAILQGRPAICHLSEMTTSAGITTWTGPARRYAVQALKCVYVYGFLGVVLPSFFALLLQFYFLLPLHTYVLSLATTPGHDVTISNTTNVTSTETFIQAVSSNGPAHVPNSTQHTIHILQDYCLGILYVRLMTRFILTAPNSRAAEAFRRITANGYLNPNVRLATRFLIAPVTLLAAAVLLLPPTLAKLAMMAVEAQLKYARHTSPALSEDARTSTYRYSYPLAAGLIALTLCGWQLSQATSRWRARIKDEVYLVGERLHNFGEKRPPVSSKSVVRRG